MVLINIDKCLKEWGTLVITMIEVLLIFSILCEKTFLYNEELPYIVCDFWISCWNMHVR
jgi:hypothetical protein